MRQILVLILVAIGIYGAYFDDKGVVKSAALSAKAKAYSFIQPLINQINSDKDIQDFLSKLKQ